MRFEVLTAQKIKTLFQVMMRYHNLDDAIL